MSRTAESRQCLTGICATVLGVTGIVEDLELVWYSSLGKSSNPLKSVSSDRDSFRKRSYDIADGAGVSNSCVIFTVGRNILTHPFWASLITDDTVHASYCGPTGHQTWK